MSPSRGRYPLLTDQQRAELRVELDARRALRARRHELGRIRKHNAAAIRSINGELTKTSPEALERKYGFKARELRKMAKRVYRRQHPLDRRGKVSTVGAAP